MAKAYWIGHVDVQNDEGYKPYAAANAAIFRKYGGRFVVRAGKFEMRGRDEPLAQRRASSFPITRRRSPATARPNTRPTSRCASRTPASISSSSKATTARSRELRRCRRRSSARFRLRARMLPKLWTADVAVRRLKLPRP